METDYAGQTPCNIEAEKYVIGAVLYAPEKLEEVRSILHGGTDFFRDDHEQIWVSIEYLHDHDVAVDQFNLLADLDRRNLWHEGQQYGGLFDVIVDCMGSVPTPDHAAIYADHVREKAAKRELILQAQETIRDTLANGQTSRQLVDGAFSRLDLLLPEEEEPWAETRPWPVMPPEAWHGPAGELVERIAPHTEADPAAILVQFLVGFANACGPRPRWRIGATWHRLNLFACIVGQSAKARKGTSWDHVVELVGGTDPEWKRGRIQKGMVSGEGIIHAVRDAADKPNKDGKTDDGVDDKRLLVVETEFGSTTMNILQREGNTLGGILKEAWDSGFLQSMAKNSPVRATDALVSIIAHMTLNQAARKVSSEDIGGGLYNRFLWVCARRAQYLPHGGKFYQENVRDLSLALTHALRFAQLKYEDQAYILLERTAGANELWEQVYRPLTDARPGLLGAITSRAEAQVMRLAAIYAILDETRMIAVEHLAAGLAVWKYCDESAGYVFGDELGDPDMEKLIAAVVEAGDDGLSQTDIRRKVFKGKRTKGQIEALLGKLQRSGMGSVHLVNVEGYVAKTKPVWKSTPPGGGGARRPRLHNFDGNGCES